MIVFLTGATGYIGGSIANALRSAGHTVTGLARSDQAAAKLRAKGIQVHTGDLTSPASLLPAVAAADGVIHAGTTNDGALDLAAVHAILEALHGSGKPFLYTSGIWVLGDTGGRVADESWPLNPAAAVTWRPAVEQLVLAAGIVIRPGIVYGHAGGIPAGFVQTANETGAALYVGDGDNRWPLIQADDLADLYVRALERASAGTLLHAADGTAHRVKEIAEAASFGAGAAGKTKSWPLDEARQALGAYADALVLDQQISAEKARRLLGWRPHAVDLLDELRAGYRAS